MATIRVTNLLNAPPLEVWDDISNIDTHPEWMQDAVRINFLGDRREGPGVAFDCETRVGPFRVIDQMMITEWDPPARMGVRHSGVVRGEGRFTLEAHGTDRTRFTWEETLRFPWWMGGPVGALVGAPIFRMIWRRNLVNLAARFPRR